MYEIYLKKTIMISSHSIIKFIVYGDVKLKFLYKIVLRLSYHNEHVSFKHSMRIKNMFNTDTI